MLITKFLKYAGLVLICYFKLDQCCMAQTSYPRDVNLNASNSTYLKPFFHLIPDSRHEDKTLIKWSGTNEGDTIAFYLYRGHKKVLLVNEIINKQGKESFEWKVPGEITAGDRYRMKATTGDEVFTSNQFKIRQTKDEIIRKVVTGTLIYAVVATVLVVIVESMSYGPSPSGMSSLTLGGGI